MTEPQSAFAAPDVFAHGLFPLCPATHDLGIRRLFDLATLLMLLDCRPGDTVLDLGAGPGFASEMMARLGYDVVALDPNREAILYARRRPGWDRDRIAGQVRGVQGSAERLPLADAAVDGVLGMNVLHHVADLPAMVSELARVLKAGCRAVFVEPGADHLDAEETKRAMREHGEDDRAFDVLGFLRLARGGGFRHAMLTATLQPALRLLPLEEIDVYRAGDHPRAHLRPEGVVDELVRRHAFAMVEKNGVRPKTSRHPGLLGCDLQVEGVPVAAASGARFAVTVQAVNTGDTTWLAQPSRRGGFVTAGCKLTNAGGRLISDTLGRTFLPHDVAPGETMRLTMPVSIPHAIDPGSYTLQFDLVDEQVCWFSDVSPGSAVARVLVLGPETPRGHED